MLLARPIHQSQLCDLDTHDSFMPSDDDDPYQRAEFERAIEEFERTRRIAPSPRVSPPGPRAVMSRIVFNDVPLIWLGDEHTVFVTFHLGEAMLGKPPEVTWRSLDPAVLAIRGTSRNGSARSCTLFGAAPGETSIVATSQDGQRQELEVRVVDREKIEIQWF